MSAINISGVDEKTVGKLQETILSILGANHTDEKTKQMALEVLGTGIEEPSYITINGCSFVNEPDKQEINDEIIDDEHLTDDLESGD